MRAVAPLPDMAHLDTVSQQPLDPPTEPTDDPAPQQHPAPADLQPQGWSIEPFETREVRKARERADRAARRAGRAAYRLQEAQERTARQRSGGHQLLDVAGDAATAALTAVSAAADEAQARLTEKARMRELEQAVVTVRAGGSVAVSPPTRQEALKLADRVDPGSSGASFVRGMGFIVAGLVAFTMIQIGGFGWLGFVVPVVILMAGGSLADRIQRLDRRQKADHIQLELARASLGAAALASAAGAPAASAGPLAARPTLLENGDPRTRAEVLAVLDRIIANVVGRVPETDVATLRRIRDNAARALPTSDEPLDLTDHDVWLLRQICIDYVPGALDHFIALPPDRASEPLLDGRSARQVLDEQLALIERRLEEMATRSYRLEAGGLLSHARFVADSLRPDPFQARIAELAAAEAKAEPVSVAREPARPSEASMPMDPAVVRERERA